MPISQRLSWIAVDWGSSNLRAWAIGDDGRGLARGGSQRGMLSLAPGDYETALLEVVGDWLPVGRRTPVLVCGMAGARQGWCEAAYLPLPARLDDLARGAVSPTVADPRLAVQLLPGLCQTREGAFDVMRGEETQLAGLVADDGAFSGLVGLPGTHAKWARLEQGAVSRFTTCLSGELYGLLARQSLLKHSIGEDDLAAPGDREAFVSAVRDLHANPGRYSAALFGLRAADLLDGELPSGAVRGARLAARLSGLTIGLELAGLGSELTASDPITLIGNTALCTRYALALESLGYASRCLDGDTAVLAGLGLAYQALPS
ncbi:2-keto-3-deoxy-galactonokinase [Halomonas sp. 1513]|nr:2-dehydro-3-deoxygalactonokinase [Halomonas sp. 1513]APX94886.1 2-keto-3-deoxy-galactonokinase [Halomonas sp. 1513]